MFVITRLEIAKQEVSIIALYETLESALAYVYQLETDRTCKFKQGNLVKVYAQGRLYNSHIFSYQVIELPPKSA